MLEQGNLLASVPNAKDLQAAIDNLYLEHGEAFLQRLLNALKDANLFLNRDDVAIVVEEAAEDVTELDNGDLLLDALATNVVQNLLKEVNVVVQVPAEVELGLELFPYVAWLGEGGY